MGSRGRILQMNENFGSTPFTRHERLLLHNERGLAEIEVPRERRSTAIFADFVEAARERRAPVAPGEAGKKALEAVLGVYASAATGREVRVPFSSDDPVYRRGARGISELDVLSDGLARRKGIFGL